MFVDEVEFSNALFSKSNWILLKQILETEIGKKFYTFKVISREFPVAKARRITEANMKKIGFIDLLAVGFSDKFVYIFIIEIKRKLTKVAITQVKDYLRAFWYFISENLNFLSLWAKTLLKISIPDYYRLLRENKIRLIPAVIYFKKTKEIMHEEREIVLIKIEERGKLIRQIFENYVKDRYNSVIKKFPELKEAYDRILAKFLTFMDIIIPYYPTLIKEGIEVKGITIYSRGKKSRVIKELYKVPKEIFLPMHFPARAEPDSSLDIFFRLMKGQSGEFIIQLFTNGIDKGRPSIYLQLDDNEYLTLQMSEHKTTSWRINGIFNKFVAYDCEPLSEPIFDGSYCLVRGKYKISKLSRTNVLRLEMFVNEQLNVNERGKCYLERSNMKLESFIIGPKLKHIFKENQLASAGLSINTIREFNLMPYMNPETIWHGITKLRYADKELKRKIFDNELMMTPIFVYS